MTKQATHKKIKERAGILGRVTLTSFTVGNNKEAKEIEKFLNTAIDISPELFEQKIQRLKQLCDFKEKTFKNQVVSVGRQCFAGRLVGETTYTGIINYGALGTGSTAISDSDTVLDTEVKRKAVATRSRTGTSVTVRFFFTKSDTNGTYEEFGTFIDGSASADSGQLFNRVLTGGWTKSSSETLTVTVQFDLNPA